MVRWTGDTGNNIDNLNHEWSEIVDVISWVFLYKRYSYYIMDGDKLFFCIKCNTHKRIVEDAQNLFVFNSQNGADNGIHFIEELTCEEIQIKKLLE